MVGHKLQNDTETDTRWDRKIHTDTDTCTQWETKLYIHIHTHTHAGAENYTQAYVWKTCFATRC